MKTFETKYGTVSLRFAMIDTDGTNLEEGIEIKLDGKFIGEDFNLQSHYINEMNIDEIEVLVKHYINYEHKK